MAVSKDHYYRLASDREDERIGAAVQLINELNDTTEAQEWEYAIQRLIKGLGSSRASARIGFSTALTEIINIRYTQGLLPLPELMGLINEHTKVSASMNGKEERAVLFGKLFGLQCISNTNSGVFNKVLDDDFRLFIDNLIDLSCAKSWIREPALFTVFTLLKSIYSKISDELTFYLFEKLDKNKLSLTTEGLALYLAIPQQDRSKLNKLNWINTTWKNADPLHSSNLTLLSKVLKDISTGDESEQEEKNSKKKGSWSPRLHFVWQLIVLELTSDATPIEAVDEQVKDSKKRKKTHDNKSKKSKSNDKNIISETIQIPEFWKVIIDESFFSEKSSNERKYWGFEVFELFYVHCSENLISSLFTQNFMRTLINHSADSNRMLNKIAKRTLRTICDTCATQPGKAIATIESMVIGPYGNLHFDRLTKSKTTEALLSVKASNLSLANIFIQVLNRDDTEDTETKLKTQKWATDQLLHLVRAKKSSMEKNSDVEWIDVILKALIQRAYFKQSETTKDDDENPIIEFTQDRINSILSDVISIQRTDNQTWSYKTLNSLLEFIDAGNKPLLQFDEELDTVKTKSLKILKKIRSKRESQHSDTSRLLVFELLFSMVVLQLYSGDAESVNTLEELQDYYYANKKSDDEDQSDSVLGIVEILMNFLSQKSSLLKKLSLIIWENWCDKVNLEGLQLLFDVLVTKENKEGQRALFEGEDEFIGEDEEEEDEEEEDNSSESSSESSSDDADEDDADEDDDEDEESCNGQIAEVEKKTNVALAEALRIPHDGEVFLSSDNDDDVSDDSMDDEQMMEIDGHLSKIFQQRREALNQVQTGNKRKQEKVDAKESIVLFKHRVVDLIDVYVKKNPTSELIIETVAPLLRALRLTLDKSLGVKIHKLLKNRVCKAKPAVVAGSRDKLLTLLASVHEDLLRTSNTNDFNLSSSQCSIFLAKQAVAVDAASVDVVVDLYAALMKLWWKKKNARLGSSFFFDFINWMGSKRAN